MDDRAGPAARAIRPWLDRWGLVLAGEPFTTSFGSHLAPVLSSREAAMLKVAVGEEERRGAHTMMWFAGQGAARVLAHEDPAILLERATGARSLAAMARNGADEEAMAILARTALALHRPRAAPPPAELVPLPVWFRALPPAAGRRGGIFRVSLAAAQALLAAPASPVVLHGDIHHDNVLDFGARGWLAIDPKGLFGEAGFDFANMLCNPGPEVAGSRAVLAARITIVAKESGLEPRRLLAWTLAWAGLSACWTLDEGEDASPALLMAELAAAELQA